MDKILILSIIIFAIVLLSTALILLYFYFKVQSRIKSRTLKERFVHKPASVDRADSEQKNNQPARVKQFITMIVSMFGEYAQPKSAEDHSRIRQRLINVGYRGINAVKVFIGIKFVCALALLAILYFYSLFFPIVESSISLMLFYIILALVGYLLPTLWLKIKIADRQQKMLDSFPNVLDMLVVCVESGIGLDAAIERVAIEMEFENKALSEEFKQYNKETRIGKTRRQALRDLAVRTGLEEVRAMTTLLVQTEKFGTSIAKSLRTHSEYMRAQRLQRAEERAAKLSVKLVIPLIFCIFPSVFIVILGPIAINAIRIIR